jgi:hypothetical protein
MKYTVTTKDKKTALRLTKSQDMAFALWQIIFNLRKRCIAKCETDDQETGVNIVFDEINDILIEYGINIEELTE